MEEAEQAYGISNEEYYDTYFLTLDATGVKNQKGDTIPGSVSLEKRYLIDRYGDFTPEQRKALYGYMGVSDSVANKMDGLASYEYQQLKSRNYHWNQ